MNIQIDGLTKNQKLKLKRTEKKKREIQKAKESLIKEGQFEINKSEIKSIIRLAKLSIKHSRRIFDDIITLAKKAASIKGKLKPLELNFEKLKIIEEGGPDIKAAIENSKKILHWDLEKIEYAQAFRGKSDKFENKELFNSIIIQKRDISL